MAELARTVGIGGTVGDASVTHSRDKNKTQSDSLAYRQAFNAGRRDGRFI